jgi:hypothetical protein
MQFVHSSIPHICSQTLLAFRSFFSDCSVVPLHPDVMEQAAELRASAQLAARF